jgi:hypothetical protein
MLWLFWKPQTIESRIGFQTDNKWGSIVDKHAIGCKSWVTGRWDDWMRGKGLMPKAGGKIPDAGCQVPDSGYQIPDIGNYLNAKSIEVLKGIFYCDPTNNLTILQVF